MIHISSFTCVYFYETIYCAHIVKWSKNIITVHEVPIFVPNLQIIWCSFPPTLDFCDLWSSSADVLWLKPHRAPPVASGIWSASHHLWTPTLPFKQPMWLVVNSHLEKYSVFTRIFVFAGWHKHCQCSLKGRFIKQLWPQIKSIVTTWSQPYTVGIVYFCYGYTG